MTNRPAGGARSKRWERADYDWYCEQPWVIEQLFDNMDFGEGDALDAIYDPCCGRGNVLDVAKARGHTVFGGDIVARGCRHPFALGDILRDQPIPKPMPGHSLSVVCNPPFSYEEDICERVIRRVLERVRVYRAAFIVPIGFLCSEGRWAFFAKEFNPSHILICSQRPTMPPGRLIRTMATPFEGGMNDFVWIIFTGPRHRWKTETRWMKPVK